MVKSATEFAPEVLRDVGPLVPERCPFDGEVSPSIESNLEHMASCHGFFVVHGTACAQCAVITIGFQEQSSGLVLVLIWLAIIMQCPDAGPCTPNDGKRIDVKTALVLFVEQIPVSPGG